MIPRADAAVTSFVDWRRVLDVNLDAVFLLTQLVAAPMPARGSGAIVNIASLLSFQGGLQRRRIHREQARRRRADEGAGQRVGRLGVNVNAVAPGYIVTNNTSALREDPERET